LQRRTNWINVALFAAAAFQYHAGRSAFRIDSNVLIISIIATIALGLLVDQHGGTWGQLVVDVLVWLLFIALVRRAAAREQLALIACVLFATIGEIFLSLVWGLYAYRLDSIPLFVPPGHALLYLLGTRLAPRLTDRLVWAVPLLAAPFVAALAIIGTDSFGVPLLALLVACMTLGPARKLYAMMFVLALVMEIYGTWLGNWTWSPHVPWLGLAALNPPLAAGAFYCVLDLLVTATIAARDRRATGPVLRLPASMSRQP
jgi:hypothetical protein